MLQKKSSGMARAKSLLVLPLLCTAVLAFAETKYVPVEDKDTKSSQNVVKTSDDNVLILVNGKSVKSLDLIDPATIQSMTVIKDKERMKQYGKAVKGKDGVIEVKLRANSDSGKEPELNGKVLTVRTSTDGGKELKVLKMKGNSDSVKELELNGKVISVQTPADGGNVLYVVDGKVVKSIDDIAPDTIESMTVIKEKEQMKKYGKAAKGKDGVIEVKLRSEK